MNRECSIVQDLLPLYAEAMTGEATTAYVEEHLSSCEVCRSEWKSMQESPRQSLSVSPEAAAPFKRVKHVLRMQKIRLICLTCLFVAALCITAFSALSAPTYWAYSEERITVTENTDGSVLIRFSEDVTDFHCFRQADPDGNATYFIEAWTSVWGRFFAPEKTCSTVIAAEAGQRPTVYYVQNNGDEDVLLCGQADADGQISLPRLVLAYYLIILGGLFCLMLPVWFCVKKRPSARRWIGSLLLFPPAYALAHLCVKGWSTVSYALQRDLSLILLLSILWYAILLLGACLITRRKEVKGITF